MNDRKLKIFQVTTRLSMGGVPLYVYRLASYLHQQGHETTIVYGQADPGEGQLFDYIDKNACGFLRVEIRGLVREISFFQDMRAFFSLAKFFWKERPDIVHTHTSKAGCLGRLAAFITRVPIVIHSSHGTIVHGYFSPRKTKILIQVERWLKKITHYIVPVTELVRQELLQYSMAYPEKSVTIHAGFDLSGFKNIDSSRGALRREININAGTSIVGTVARLVPVKALDDLLRAAKIILDKKSNVCFVIAGDGESRKSLERLAKELGIDEKVIFLGFRSDLVVLYASFDIVVVSSLNEGCPASILEAMAANVPVVATNVGGVPDIIKSGFTGLLVSPRNPQQLADSVLHLVENANYRKELAHNAKDTAYREYSIEVSAARTEKLYLQLHGAEARPI